MKIGFALAAQHQQAAAQDAEVEIGIEIHHLALEHVARPDPAVALQAVKEKLPLGDAVGIAGDIVNFVDERVGTGKRARDRRVAAIFGRAHLYALVGGVHEGIAQAHFDGRLRLAPLIDGTVVERFAVPGVQRLLAAFAVADGDGASL